MSKTCFVESNQFNQMLSYKPYATTNQEKREVKYSLLDRIKQGVGDTWERFKEGTRQAFDMICFLGAELGFVYAGAEYMAERHDISDRTVRARMKELEELGQVVKVYRRAKKCNGKGKPVYLFTNHPYFNYWVKLLGLNLADFHTDFHTENTETPTESKEEEAKKVPTYILPTSLNNNHLNNSHKRKQYLKYLPKKLQHFQDIFGKSVGEMYSRMWLAPKKLGISVEQETMQQIGLIAMDKIKGYLKEGKVQTEEERCRMAYKIAEKQLIQREESKGTVTAAVQFSAPKKVVRKEVLPDWFNGIGGSVPVQTEPEIDYDAMRKHLEQELKKFKQ